MLPQSHELKYMSKIGLTVPLRLKAVTIFKKKSFSHRLEGLWSNVKGTTHENGLFPIFKKQVVNIMDVLLLEYLFHSRNCFFNIVKLI